MDFNEYYRKGIKLAADGDYDAAIEVFSTYLSENPNSLSFLDRRADAWLRKGEEDKARADYTRMIAANPKSPDGWNYRGLRYDEAGEYDKAIADFTEAIACMPERCGYWSNRGISYYKKKDFDKALEDLNKSIELDPEFSWALGYRGTVWKNKGNFDEAIADYTLALAYEPEEDWILGQRGYCLFMKNEFDAAIADYTRAIEAKPDDAELWLGRGICNWGKKDDDLWSLCADDFTKAIELDPANTYAYFCRGIVYYTCALEQMNFMKAIITSRVKDEAERLVLMGQLAHIGYKELVPMFNNFLGALRSNKTEVENILMNCSNLLGQDFATDGITDFTEVIAREPDNDEAFYLRGFCYTMLGDPDKSLADYAQALTLNPYHPKAAKKHAELLESLNKK
jgi:tetratricopeptide (TPR) repeat protein